MSNKMPSHLRLALAALLVALVALSIAQHPPAPASGAPSGSAPPVGLRLEDLDLVKLSKLQAASRKYDIPERCQMIEWTIRQMIPQSPLSKADNVHLLEGVHAVLSQRKLPFNNPQNLLTSIETCTIYETEKANLLAAPPRFARPAAESSQAAPRVAASMPAAAATMRPPVNNNPAPAPVVRQRQPVAPAEQVAAGPQVAAAQLAQRLEQSQAAGRTLEAKLADLQSKLAHSMQLNSFLENKYKEAEVKLHQLSDEESEKDAIIDQLQRGAAQRGNLVSEQEYQTAQARYLQMKQINASLMARQAREVARNRAAAARVAELESQVASLAEEANNRQQDGDEQENDNQEDQQVAEAANLLEQLARKLQTQMSPQEPQSSRCLKYVMLLNYPKKKISPRTVKAIGRLMLPFESTEASQNYAELLDYFAGALSATGGQAAALAAQELRMCLALEQEKLAAEEPAVVPTFEAPRERRTHGLKRPRASPYGHVDADELWDGEY